MSEKQWLFWIEEIRTCIRKAKMFSAQKNLQEFSDDLMTRDAVALNIGNIGEYIKHIPDATKQKYAHIPWRDIRGMRNFIVHDYPGIDWEALWNVVQDDLDGLDQALKDILEKEDT